MLLMNKAAGAVAQENNPNEGFWRKLTLFGAFAELLIALFIMFGRADFFDLLIGMLLALYIQNNVLREIISLRIFSFIILGSILLDFIWLGIYSGNWSDPTKYGEAGSTTKSFVMFFSWINLIVKLLLACLCYMLNIQMSKQRGSIPKVVMRDDQTTNV
mmetsp:Transcript_22450/g.19394  ORF Transcript_22450/g.19394 Transcript_22450/m.19394 type:complete len:159 (-) Transcript_22450:513-989(-)